MGDNVLEAVYIARVAMDRWVGFACTELRVHGQVHVSDISNRLAGMEAATVESDGSLTIYVEDKRHGRLSMRIEPHEWKWLDKQPDKLSSLTSNDAVPRLAGGNAHSDGC